VVAYQGLCALKTAHFPFFVLAKIAGRTLPANVWQLVMLALLINALVLRDNIRARSTLPAIYFSLLMRAISARITLFAIIF